MKSLLRCSLIIFSLSAASIHAQDSPKVIEIHAKRFSFTPSEITLVKGGTVTLNLIDDDNVHGLSIPELNTNATMNTRKAPRVEGTPAPTGTFNGQCNHFCGVGHGSMLFKVTVKD